MTEQSFLFDFSKSPSFFENFNESFSLSDMNTSKTATDPLENFKLIIASYSPDNIDDCLDEDGVLNSSVTIGKNASNQDLIVNCGLDYLKTDDGNATIELHSDTTFTIGDTIVPLKAIFLATLDGYVLGYSINTVSFTVTNSLVFDKDLIFWDIRDE